MAMGSSLLPFSCFSLQIGVSNLAEHTAARAIGSEELENKFNESLKCLERQSSVAFAASLVRLSRLACFRGEVDC